MLKINQGLQDEYTKDTISYITGKYLFISEQVSVIWVNIEIVELMQNNWFIIIHLTS